jgi:hypothetical protein
MDALITMQCGPIRHEIEDRSSFAKHLIVHRCHFTTDEPGTDGASIQAIYGGCGSFRRTPDQGVAPVPRRPHDVVPRLKADQYCQRGRRRGQTVAGHRGDLPA